MVGLFFQAKMIKVMNLQIMKKKAASLFTLGVLVPLSSCLGDDLGDIATFDPEGQLAIDIDLIDQYLVDNNFCGLSFQYLIRIVLAKK